LSLNLSQIIQKKNFNSREKDFVNKLIKKGGEFTNKHLAELWGTKTFPSNFKKKLVKDFPILVLIQNKPQKYVLITEKGKMQIPTKKEVKISDTPITISEKNLIPEHFFQEIQNLKMDYYKFKENAHHQFQNILVEIQALKNLINIPQRIESDRIFLINIEELEKEIFMIYNQLKFRPHQPVKIEEIWQKLHQKYYKYKWETFSDQILKINSPNFHLEEGRAGRSIYDPNNDKKYGYVIGN